MKSKRMLSIGIVFLLSVTLARVSANAQELRGKITGRVLDSTKAVVPGATVKVIDVARNIAITMITNENGLFEALYLLPGTYQVQVELKGFRKAVQDNVQVQINETRSLEITLAIGGTEETVSVSDEALVLNTTDSNLGQTIDRKRVDELPSVHGDPYVLMNLTPGVAYTGSTRLDRPFEPTHIANFAMGGARGIRSDLLVDGAPSTATANANEVIATYVPTTDTTQEFRVQTATFDAQFGNTEGGVTSIVTKGGTNQYHGSAYYWIEPGGWAANDFFGNARGQGRPFTYSNRPGLSLGGPLRIPQVYDGKNKSFFFFSYESIDDSRPRFDANNIWAPTDALKRGDFSAYINSVKIYDPQTGTFANGTVTNRTAFQDNVIPTNRINSVALAVLPFLGSPKHGPQDAASLINNNITDSTLAETLNPPYRNYTLRLDHNLSDRDKVFGRYSWYNRNSTYNNYTGTLYVGDRFLFKSKQGVLDEVHTFNSQTLLNLRYSYNRFIRGSDAPEGQYGLDLTTLGFPASYNSSIGAGVRRFPRFDFNCTSCTGAPVGNGHTNEYRPVDSHFMTAVLNRTQGKHSLRFGGEMRIYREDDNFKNNNQSGQFTFDNTYTRAGSASSADVEGLQAFAAFLLGYPSTMQIVRAADYSEYSRTWGFFAQDDWRVSDKLTVNLGLRWEFEQPLTERQNKSISGFDLSSTQPFQAQAQTNFGLIGATDVLKTTYGLTTITTRGGLLFAGKDTGSGLYKTPKNGFLPRLGFAYQWNSKTVFRGGFGLFQGFLGERRGDVIQTGYSQTTIQPLSTGPNGAPLPFLVSNPFPNGITDPSGNALGEQTALGQNITFFNQNPKVAKQARWSFGIQSALGGWVLEANYLGDYGYDIEINRNLNALPNTYLNQDNSRTAAMNTNNTNLGGTVRSPFCNSVNGSSCDSGALYTGAGGTISRRQLLMPFPEFGSITTTNNDGKTWYHSGQFSLSRRFSRGYGLQAAYTWSKWLQATEYLNASDPTPTKVISDQDVPHRVSMSAFYELPFGKGRPFFTDAGRLAGAFIGGWQAEGTFTYQTGFPVGFTSDAFYLGGKVSLPNSQQTLSRWFNTDAFVSVVGSTPVCGAFPSGSANCATPVDHQRTLPLRFPDVRIDAVNNVDLGLRKDISLRESMKIQLRMEFINAFNHPLFPGPTVTPGSTTFGQVTASNQNNYARRAQMVAKFIF